MRNGITLVTLTVCVLLGGACDQNSAPATPGAPVGPPVGMVRESLNFRVATTDPESDSIRYRLDWGDGLDDWTGFFASGESCAVGHTWYVRDTYAVRVQAEDEHSHASEWSPAFVVSIESLCRR
jgi:hypothetical protein